MSSTDKADLQNINYVTTFLATLHIHLTLSFLPPSPWTISLFLHVPTLRSLTSQPYGLFLTESSSIPVLQHFGKHADCYLLLPLLHITGTTSNAETPLRLYTKTQPLLYCQRQQLQTFKQQKDPASSRKSILHLNTLVGSYPKEQGAVALGVTWALMKWTQTWIFAWFEKGAYGKSAPWKQIFVFHWPYKWPCPTWTSSQQLSLHLT